MGYPNTLLVTTQGSARANPYNVMTTLAGVSARPPVFNRYDPNRADAFAQSVPSGGQSDRANDGLNAVTASSPAASYAIWIVVALAIGFVIWKALR